MPRHQPPAAAVWLSDTLLLVEYANVHEAWCRGRRWHVVLLDEGQDNPSVPDPGDHEPDDQ